MHAAKVSLGGGSTGEVDWPPPCLDRSLPEENPGL